MSMDWNLTKPFEKGHVVWDSYVLAIATFFSWFEDSLLAL
jgi:hypothetical protein